ncbi:MAG: hypothetical protein KAJ19_26325 [Gammaproteobacteria bacterium]|nr:hypothetical protein [Gammaproteobacteria bacterium]
MLVKIKDGDNTLQFDSRENAIAILLTPKDKEHIETMSHNDLMILSAPFQLMKDKAVDAWHWAMNGWQGATWIPNDGVTQSQLNFDQLRKF